MRNTQDSEKLELMRQKIISLFDNSGKEDTELEREIGLPRSIIYDWRNKRNRSFRSYLPQIATYFNVSLDWLAGTEQKNKPSAEAEGLSKEAIELSKRIDRLSPANRAKLDELIDLYLSAQDKKK